jgi:hypothetical protein
MGRIAIIGDVGGHPDQLRAALIRLGADPLSLRLPADLTIVQVGDLIDRGPDSAGVLTIVRDRLDSQASQWIQLVGNHEGQYLEPGQSFWAERLRPSDAALIRTWWNTGWLRVAVAIRSGDNDLLVTHAGLTVSAWQALGSPETATEAARLLNDRPPLIWSGIEPAGLAGPLWAEAGTEVYEPWMRWYAMGGMVPFDQVHGHSSLVHYPDRSWRCPGRVRERAQVDWGARLVRTRIGGRVFHAVDPKHGKSGAEWWQPLILDDARLVQTAAA